MPRSSWSRALRKLSARAGTTAVASRKRSARASRPRCELLEERAVPAVLSAFLTTEHVDIDIGYPGGPANGWSLEPRDDDNGGVAYDPEVALLYVGDNAQSLTARPGGAAFDFVGVAAGEDFYRLPQSQDPELLYLGVAGYGVTPSNFDRYNPSAESKGRVSGLGRWVKMSLVDVEHVTPEGQPGGGIFSVWQSADAGPNAFMSSYDDGVSNPNASGLDTTDGIGADDALWIVAGGHIHYNWGFTEKGRYEVTVKLSGYLVDDGQSTPNEGGYVESAPITLYFSVGSVGDLEFDASSYTVDEGAGTATIGVRRVGGSDGRITVNYAMSDGTAAAGADYTASSGTLTFNDGETYKTITVPILDDGLAEADETVDLILSNPGPSSIDGYYVNYEGDDNGLLGGQATATLTILDDDAPPPNNPPTISNVADLSTAEDTSTGAIAFTVGDVETSAAALVVTATSSNPALVPAAGIVLGGSGASRTVTLTPAADRSGSATITLTVTDAGGLTATDTFVLTVDPVNDAPTISPFDDVIMDEDEILEIPFTVGDAETPPGDLIVEADSSVYFLPYVIVDGDGANRTLRLILNSDEAGESTVTVTVTDGDGESTSRSFHVTVNPVYDPPRLLPDNLLAIPDTTSTLDVLANDRAIEEGQAFGFQSITQPSHGTLAIEPGGKTLRYTPTAGYTGPDEFTYTVVDNTGATSTTTGYVTVAPYLLVDSPDFPQHTDIYYNYVDGQWVLNIKTDATFGPDGSEGGGNNSTLVDADEGLLFVDPSTRIQRPENSEFGNWDFLGVEAGADIWVAPWTPEGDLIYLGFSTEGTEPATFASFTATDPRVAGQTADWMVMELVGFSGPGHFSMFDFDGFGQARVWIDTADGLNGTDDGAAGGNPDDSFWAFGHAHAHENWVFTAAGRYELQFRAVGWTDDRSGNLTRVESPVTTYYFDVDAETSPGERLGEAPPIAAADTASAAENGGPVVIDVLANDSSSPDPIEVLAVTGVTQAAHGVVAIAEDGGSVTYTPNAGFSGEDEFTYTITDEHGGQATATVTVAVTPDGTNEAPTISLIADQFVVENASAGPIPFTIGDAETPVSDLVVTASSSNPGLVPEGNIAVGGGDAGRTLTITPIADQIGSTTITVTVTDADGLQTSEAFVLTVTANRLVPFAMPAYYGGTLAENVWDSVTADFDGDGKADLITSAGGAPLYFQGTGNGGFLPELALATGLGFSVEGIAAVDYEGDGDADLLAYEANWTTGEGAITLHRNDGTGQFTRIVIKGGLQNGYNLEVGDFDEDGRPDVAYSTSVYDPVTTTQTLAFHYALQQAGGELGPEMTPWTSNGYGSLLVGDVNGDGNLDIVGAETVYAPDFSSWTSSMLTFPGGGDGTFGAPQSITSGDFPTLQQIVDVNGDGRADIVVSDRVGDSRVGYYPQQADGSLGGRVGLLPGIGQLNALRVADFNEDGVPDLVSDTYSADYSSLSVSWSPGLGGGAFGPAIIIAPNDSNINTIQVVDLDGDSYPDIVAGGYGSNTQPPLRVFLNKTGEDPMVLIPPAARGYVAGDPIDVQVYFGFPITVTGTPRIALQVGDNTVYANYVGGSGLPTLTFRYTVSSTDVDQDGVQLASNIIDLNGGTLTDPIGGAGVLEFPNLEFSSVIVNGAGPLVQMISRLDATPTDAGTVRFAVQFAEDVTGVDADDFAVRMIEGDLAGAGVVSVSGSGSLYEVTVSTGTGSGTLGLSVLESASIFDLDGDVLGKGYAAGQVYTVRPEPVGPIDMYYVEGHCDYRPLYDNGEFSYVLNDGYNAIPSDEVITYLDSTALVNRQADARYDFLGVGAGEPYYLSDSNGSVATVPYLGWSGESLPGGTFASYRPADQRITSNTPQSYLKVQMVGMRSSNGGEFSLYSIPTSGPRIWMATSDGISDTDVIYLTPGSHLHRNTAFSKPGTYEVDVVISGYLDSNGNGVYDPIVDPYTESGIKTMVFHVDTLGARDDAFEVDAGETLEGSVTANDEWHPALGEWTASVVTTATDGTLTLQPDGSFTYVPAAGFAGTDSFVYQLANERGGFTTATVTLTVNDSNVAPTAVDDAYLISPGSVLRANVLANDSDPDGDTLIASPLVAPQHGTLSLAADGSFTYTPDGTFAGSDSFTYLVTDSGGTSSEATVTIGAAGYQDFQAIVAPGHADVGINYEDGAWDLHVHYDEIGKEYEPDQAIYYVAPGALSDRPEGPDFDFIGVGAGQPFYRLPQTENPELLYLGLGAEELADGTFEGGTVRVYLRAVNGPGLFSLWKSTDAGPSAFFATSDGITADDYVDVLEGGHSHLNWGFTEKGRYEITIEAVGTLVGEDTPTSATATYYFSVDNLGRLSIEPADAVDEGGTQTITIRRTDGSDGPLTILYGAGGGTATPGSDFEPFGGTLTFADGETEKTLTIATIADDGVEGDETIVVDITPDRDDLPILGDPAKVTLTIRDDAPPLQVDQVLVNDGAAQRSNIETLTVRFSRETNLQALIDGGDIVDAVKVYSGGSEVVLSSARFQYDAATDSLVIDLTGDGFGGSRSTLLADGDYELQLDAAMIATTGQAPANGLTDNDGTYRSGFHRLQADFNGDRAVSAADVDLFLAHYGGIEGRTDGKYDFAFDLTGAGDEPDGVINLFDYVLMRKRMGRRL